MNIKFNSRINYIISSHQSDPGRTYFKVYTSSGVFLFHSMESVLDFINSNTFGYLELT